MISEIYTPLVERRSINKYLGVLTKKNYKAEMRKLFDKSQLLGEELEDNQVNEYATSFMAKHLRSGEVMLDKQEQRNLCSQYNLDAYESDVWVNLSSGECLAGNCVIDKDHPDPMAISMSAEFCELHKSMSGMIIYRPYMILRDIRKILDTDKPITTSTVELCVLMLMAHERRHSIQSADMINKCNTWMQKQIREEVTEEEKLYYDVAEEDANHARLDYGAEILRSWGIHH